VDELCHCFTLVSVEVPQCGGMDHPVDKVGSVVLPSIFCLHVLSDLTGGGRFADSFVYVGRYFLIVVPNHGIPARSVCGR
jgi:hypothetical protein